MKITSAPPEFRPVTIVLETHEELLWLRRHLVRGNNAMQNNAKSLKPANLDFIYGLQSALESTQDDPNI